MILLALALLVKACLLVGGIGTDGGGGGMNPHSSRVQLRQVERRAWARGEDVQALIDTRGTPLVLRGTPAAGWAARRWNHSILAERLTMLSGVRSGNAQIFEYYGSQMWRTMYGPEPLPHNASEYQKRLRASVVLSPLRRAKEAPHAVVEIAVGGGVIKRPRLLARAQSHL